MKTITIHPITNILDQWRTQALNWLAVQPGVNLNQLWLDPKALHIIPVSGGADSTALCILLHLLFPHIKFVLIFSDTGAEPASVYENLTKLSQVLNNPINLIQSKRNLWEQIDHSNGFLPSARDRWCTRMLKLEPFKAWMDEQRVLANNTGMNMVAHVGIRADETSRIAFQVEGLTTSTPFIEMGIQRAHVFRLLAMTIGVPSTYRSRTRSGCTVCPFMRRAEVIAMLTNDPTAFKLGEQYERLSAEDATRYGLNAVPIWQETKLARNHVGLPIPAEIDLRTAHLTPVATKPVGKVKRSDTLSLFGEMVGIWVGVEYLVHPMLSDTGVWGQRIITYSLRRDKLLSQLDLHYQHRLATAEIEFDDQDSARAEIRYGMFYLTIPSDLISTSRPTVGESYTWRSGEAYAQVRHIMSWIERTLGAEGLRSELRDLQSKRTSFAAEQIPYVQEALAKIERSGQLGEVVFQGRYDASEAENLDDVLDERYIPCPLCHV